MKISSLVLILLPTPSFCNSHSRDGDGSETKPEKIILQSMLRGSTPSEILFSTGADFVSQFQLKASSSCSVHHDASSCRLSNESCVWCECQAIPSECVSVKESRSLPPSVFTCDETLQNIEQDSDGLKKDLTDKDTLNDLFDSPVGLNFNIQDDLPFFILAEDDVVNSDLCDSSSLSLAGYADTKGSEYDANGENKHLFYWFFEKRGGQDDSIDSDETDDIPLIIWLTGGPGCSSSLALLTENGPCTVNNDGTSTSINPYSWTEVAHVLWLDQPAGVGYSYGTKNDSNESMVSEDVYYFLQSFFRKHPKYDKNRLFLVGESYGGHYAPAIAHKIWTENKNRRLKNEGVTDKRLIQINLSGLAVGNGLTNPIEQYKWYPEMAFNNPQNIKTVSEKTYEAMKSAVPSCIRLIEKCNAGDTLANTLACQGAFVVCNSAETTPYQLTGLNPYDIRKKCEHPPLCYDFSNVNKFLNLDSTKEALHVSEKARSKWQSCDFVINAKFHADWMKDFSPFVADLLNGNDDNSDDAIPVLIYAGDVDYICNYMGNKAWTRGLDWKGSEAFIAADEHEWRSKEGKETVAGLARTAGGFTFLQVYEAGHMVPSDKPEIALDMIRNFVKNGTF